MTLQQKLGLAAALVAAAIVFLTGFDKASDDVAISAYIYLALGLADSLLGAATAFLSTPQRLSAQLVANHPAMVTGDLLASKPDLFGGFSPPERTIQAPRVSNAGQGEQQL